ncbi:MAG: ABC transporter permease [Siphonobacter sp.]
MNAFLPIVRQLRRQKIYAFLHVFGLTIGIAGGILIFLFIRYHYLTDRHHSHFDRMFRVVTDLHLDDGSVEQNPEAMPPLAEELRRNYPQVEHATFFITNYDKSIHIADQIFAEHEGITLVDQDFFQVFDYQWLSGSSHVLKANTAILTQSWAKKFFGDKNPLGQRIEIDALRSVIVAGIVADSPKTTDLKTGMFLSLDIFPKDDVYKWEYLNSTNRVYATLKDPGQINAMQAAMPAIIKKAFGTEAHYYHLIWQPIKDVHFDSRTPGFIRKSLLYTLALVGLFLVVTACINFINLSIAQAFRRAKEVGVRKSLGSSRRQLIGQFLLETSLFIGFAGLLSLLVVELVLPSINRWSQTSLSLPVSASLILSFLGLLIILVLLAGLYPALVIANFKPIVALKGTLSSRHVGGVSVRKVLIITQFVVCQILIVSTLVIVSQTHYFQTADLGFKKDNILLVNLPKHSNEHLAPLRQALSSYPEIQSVSFQYRAPSSSMKNGGTFKFGDKADFETFPIREKLADSKYVDTYGIQIIAGRNITPSDTIREYLVNEAFLRKLNIKDPNQILGRQLEYYLSTNSTPLPIVGVVKDFHHLSLHETIEPCIIASLSRSYQQIGIKLSVADFTKMLPRIQSIWEKQFPNQAFEYQWYNDTLAKSYEAEVNLSHLILLFAGVAIWICGLGLFGLIRFMAETRTKEIGIRKVLGASEGQLVILFARNFLFLVVVGFAIATPISIWLLDHWLQQFAYHISLGWEYFGLTLILTLVFAFCTISYQALQAARVNPVKSLKTE